VPRNTNVSGHLPAGRRPVTQAGYNPFMSYTVTLWCGCIAYVSCHPATGLAHTRIVERRGTECRVRRHDVGVRLWLWEMLPDTPRDNRVEDPPDRTF
jgi:hypothetical protein